MAYDPIDRIVLLFGGWDLVGSGLNDTWAFANGSWKNLGLNSTFVSPPPRGGAGLVYDPRDGCMLLFGGSGPVGWLGDSWSFSHGVWKLLKFAVHPPPRYGLFMVYDARDNYVLMFGGVGRGGVQSTWTFANGAWTHLTTTNSPGARFYSAGAFDSRDGYVPLFGGETFSKSFHPVSLSDTWAFVSGVWSQLSPARAPSARMGESIGYDSGNARLILFGGDLFTGNSTGTSSTAYNDTWSYTNGSWTPRHPANAPSPRSGGSLTFDRTLGHTVLFAGANTSREFNETWELT